MSGQIIIFEHIQSEFVQVVLKPWKTNLIKLDTTWPTNVVRINDKKGLRKQSFGIKKRKKSVCETMFRNFAQPALGAPRRLGAKVALSAGAITIFASSTIFQHLSDDDHFCQILYKIVRSSKMQTSTNKTHTN